MTTTIQSYLEDGIVSFAFPKIDTYTNDKGEVKKKPIGMLNWRTINKENCLKYSVGGAYAVVTGEQSNLTIVDFDVKDEYYWLIKNHPELKDYKTIQTNKGFHIWFQYDAEFKSTTDAFSDYKGVDIRNDAGIVFCPPTTYKMPNGDMVKYVDLGGNFELPPSYLKSYFKVRNKVNSVSKPQSKECLVTNT
jgi:hypothetical protein